MTKQRVVVVTGGGSGMGKATALKFSKNGDRVYVIGRRKENLEETAKQGENIYPFVADVTDIKSIKLLKKFVLGSNKSIDVLVNCAGGRGSLSTGDDSSFEKIVEVWDQIVKINLSSVYYVTQHLKDSITSPGGRIINISSLAAQTGSSQGGVVGAAYAAAKSGVHGIDKTLAKTLGQRGITINSISPGLIGSTDFFGGDGIPENVLQRYENSILMGRLGEPEDIAAGVFYLASEEAGYITGEILNINGGVQFG